MREWKPGDLVTVVTVNRGLSVRRPRKDSKRKDPVEWVGKIVGPSLLGPGWWNVSGIRAANGRRAGSFAVPEKEIKPRKL
ncbi:hypothetical protein [Reyranella sp.]|uniref:hypothetical protein n=1 Tax=Reyranella sp. TaxID=1929291 RepID=UPI003D14F761